MIQARTPPSFASILKLKVPQMSDLIRRAFKIYLSIFLKRFSYGPPTVIQWSFSLIPIFNSLINLQTILLPGINELKFSIIMHSSLGGDAYLNSKTYIQKISHVNPFILDIAHSANTNSRVK